MVLIKLSLNHFCLRCAGFYGTRGRGHRARAGTRNELRGCLRLFSSRVSSYAAWLLFLAIPPSARLFSRGNSVSVAERRVHARRGNKRQPPRERVPRYTGSSSEKRIRYAAAGRTKTESTGSVGTREVAPAPVLVLPVLAPIVLEIFQIYRYSMELFPSVFLSRHDGQYGRNLPFPIFLIY